RRHTRCLSDWSSDVCSSDLQDQFPLWEQFFVPHGPEHWTMDLLTANTLQLQAAGVPAEQIDTASICTACHKHDLYSHRAEGQERSEERRVGKECRSRWSTDH